LQRLSAVFYGAALAETNKLIADYAGKAKLPAEMYRLAWECEEFERAYGPGGG
jgi:hypothetical protein